MNLQFTHPLWLLALPVAWAWVFWLGRRSDVSLGAWRRWTALGLRLLIVGLVVLALAGVQWKRPVEGLNVFFLLDRSDSIPSAQQEAARRFVNRLVEQKKKEDRAGVLVFGTEAALESSANINVALEKINAVIATERTDLAGAIRLGTAAFPETGQKRLVLVSDGNENIGDAMAALLAARPLGVSLDVVPIGVTRGSDVSVQRLGLPSRVKKGQTFDVKIFVQADQAKSATVRLYRNDQPLGEQAVQLTSGKNLFTFPQTLTEANFYTYSVFLDTTGDAVPQNNQATSFVHVRGDPRLLLLSSDPEADRPLAEALRSSRLEVRVGGVTALPATLAELQSYDAIFLSNLAAGDLGLDRMTLLESAVRDFGVGLVCVGGDQTYAAGAYRGTPLERTLPVNMELDSKKVLPKGAVALVMHGMEFGNGNQVSRDCALGVLDALGPQDEMGVLMWDGREQWLFPMTPAGDKKKLGRMIAGLNQGDLPSFQGVVSLGYEGLKKSTANLKHMIIFSDGDPVIPSEELMQSMVQSKITVSTVLISGHAGPDTMMWIADKGRGRFYNVQNPSDLPQIFIKEAAVILKSAISEDPFTPRLVAVTEPVRGVGRFPILRGYVATTPKPRIELPLLTDKGDPLLAHWQFGLGRAVAFTSDARAKWARDWMGWDQYRQFWSQIAQWSTRRLANADLDAEVTVEKGEGRVSVEALDREGNYRNFLTLQTSVLSPKGEKQEIRLEQTGPGRYEARFPTREVGSYLLNVKEMREGAPAGSLTVGAAVNYSPEFNAPEPNFALLTRLAEAGGGRVMDFGAGLPNPFLHDRRKTFQPVDWWEWLLKLAVILFVLDVGIRRIQIDREEWAKWLVTAKRKVFFWKAVPRPAAADESLGALLARREQVRSQQTAPATADPALFQPRQPVALPVEEKAAPPASAPSAPIAPEKTEPPASTTSRLLDAKRRARRK